MVITIKTPFYSSKKYVGIDSKDCLVIKKSDVDKAFKNGSLITFNIDFKEYNIKEKRQINLLELKQLIDSGKAKIRFNKTIGEYVININRNDCKLIH